MASLALVVPALGELLACVAEAREVGHLAEPSTDEDVLELVGIAGGEDLAVGARVELVLHDTSALNDDIKSVGLELSGELELAEAELGAPLGDDIHVASSGRSWGGRRRWGRGRSWLRSRSRSGSGSRGWLRCGLRLLNRCLGVGAWGSLDVDNR